MTQNQLFFCVKKKKVLEILNYFFLVGDDNTILSFVENNYISLGVSKMHSLSSMEKKIKHHYIEIEC